MWNRLWLGYVLILSKSWGLSPEGKEIYMSFALSGLWGLPWLLDLLILKLVPKDWIFRTAVQFYWALLAAFFPLAQRSLTLTLDIIWENPDLAEKSCNTTRASKPEVSRSHKSSKKAYLSRHTGGKLLDWSFHVQARWWQQSWVNNRHNAPSWRQPKF